MTSLASAVFSVTVVSQNGDGKSALVTVGNTMTVGTLKVLIQEALDIPSERQILIVQGRMVTDDTLTIGSIGVTEGDLITVAAIATPGNAAAVHRAPDTASLTSTPAPPRAAIDAANVPVDPGLRFEDLPADMPPDIQREVFLKNPHLLRQLDHINPNMAAAIRSDDPGAFRAFLIEQQMQKFMGQRAESMEVQRLNDNPYDMEAQRAIEERIRREQVEMNRQLAMEHSPESFTRVLMLYVPIKVQDVDIQAFVDSGAQNTIMSQSCAERCGVMRLLDRRFAGQAVGVGTAKILGKVHLAQIKFGDSFLQCSFTVMEENLGDKNMEFLLGLDMLKRYQCQINLRENCLRLHTGDHFVDVPFLSEGELPESKGGTKKDSSAPEGDDAKPSAS